MKATRSAVLFGGVLALTAPHFAQAQETAKEYPSKPVTFVVPFAPGGSTGLIARVIGQKLEQRLGKPFVVDHRAGGGGVPAVNAVAHKGPGILTASGAFVGLANDMAE